ncbi:MAG: NUDIX domain-containing protein, partial [Coprobacillus cateniformis]
MRSEKARITNLCMVYDKKGNVLVQERLKKDWPGITFPGGHVEYLESFHDSVVREVK